MKFLGIVLGVVFLNIAFKMKNRLGKHYKSNKEKKLRDLGFKEFQRRLFILKLYICEKCGFKYNSR